MAVDLVIPHQDGAGVVDAVGRRVDAAWLGARVWLHMAQWQRPWGTAAEWVVVPVDRIARLPDAYPFTLGACLGVPWLTAAHAVDALGAVRGRDVLVTGGSGAVSIYVIQLAIASGARVIATVGSEESADLATRAGASTTIDFRAADLTDRIRAATADRRVGRVVEGRVSAGAAIYPDILAAGARVVVYGTAEPAVTLDVSAAIRLRTTFRFIYSFALGRATRQRATDRLLAMEAERSLTHLPIRTYALEDTAAAHQAVEAGNHGSRQVVLP